MLNSYNVLEYLKILTCQPYSHGQGVIPLLQTDLKSVKRTKQPLIYYQNLRNLRILSIHNILCIRHITILSMEPLCMERRYGNFGTHCIITLCQSHATIIRRSAHTQMLLSTTRF